MRSHVLWEMTVFGILGLGLLGAGFLGCDSTDDAGNDSGNPVVRIVTPVAGQAFKVYDTVQIIVESDYAKFGGGVSVDYSPDSAKNWYLIHSFSRKPGLARDTVNWFAQGTGDVAAGSVILLRTYDYDRDFMMTTPEGIRFTE